MDRDRTVPDSGTKSKLAESRPLILTARLDSRTFDRLDGLRWRHFPRDRNFLSAHLTLFHALPPEWREQIERDIADVCASREAPQGMTGGWMSLGRGVAMRVDSPSLVAVRDELARRWQRWLSRQDASGFRPHVTVQNKVAPAEARSLRDRLSHSYTSRPVAFPRLELWYYDGGPWEAVGVSDFRSRLGDP